MLPTPRSTASPTRTSSIRRRRAPSSAVSRRISSAGACVTTLCRAPGAVAADDWRRDGVRVGARASSSSSGATDPEGAVLCRSRPSARVSRKPALPAEACGPETVGPTPGTSWSGPTGSLSSSLAASSGKSERMNSPTSVSSGVRVALMT